MSGKAFCNRAQLTARDSNNIPKASYLPTLFLYFRIRMRYIIKKNNSIKRIDLAERPSKTELIYDENLVFSIIGSNILTITDFNKKTHIGRKHEIFIKNLIDNLSFKKNKTIRTSPTIIPDE